ncbi:MAG: hypothetical protein K9I84_12115 [Leadbetterella sp.]|nr:hypothetical protein [Leadbetterella sp.]
MAGYFDDFSSEDFESTIFPNSLENFPFRGIVFHKKVVKVVAEFGYPRIEVFKMKKMGS